MLYTIITFLLNIVFPKFCFGCESIGTYFCDKCIAITPTLLSQRCIMCQKPSIAGFTHPVCITKYSPDRLTSVYEYKTHPISRMIITGKYNFVKDLFAVLGNIIAKQIGIDANFTIIPIPLATKRQRWRGFNQSEIIAISFAKPNNLVMSHSLIRIKHTKTQKDLSKPLRIQNMQNAFQYDFLGNVPDKVVLIDDVTTTGSTFIEATRVLKKAGVRYVWCISIAQD